MLNIFYKVNGKILVSQSETDFVSIKRESVLWIDLLAPSGEEKHATEAFLGTDIQTRAQAEEIESSSRFRETDKVIFANTNFLMPGPEEYTEEAVRLPNCSAESRRCRNSTRRAMRFSPPSWTSAWTWMRI